MKTYLLALAILPLLASAGQAKEITVKQLNSGDDGMMAFEPGFVRVQPGDTVNVIAVDPGHNVESIPTIAPAGTTSVKGAMSKGLVLHFTKPGIYGFKCLPHFSMGMVLLVQVGAAPSNLAQAKAAASTLPPLAKNRLMADFAKVK
jgi:pseudoazurin